jgi:hypothetical protein
MSLVKGHERRRPDSLWEKERRAREKQQGLKLRHFLMGYRHD